MIHLRHNLTQLAVLVADLLPSAWVRGEGYRRLRRALSRTPERYTVNEEAELPFTPGQWRERKLAGPETDLVVEGFPGSANSFLSNAIRAAIDRPVRIESHFHFTVQLKRALAHRVPTLVLIRSPGDACNSLKAKSPRTWDGLIVLRWLHYYGFVDRRRHELQVISFDDVVRDVDVVRRTVPAVDRLAGRALIADRQLRRTTPRRRQIDPGQPFVRALMRRAEARYQRLVPDRDEAREKDS